MARLWRSTLLAPLMACAGQVNAAGTVYAFNFPAGPRQVVSYPVGMPTAMTLIGPQADLMVGLDFDPAASVLWAVNSATQTIGTLSTTTGAFSPSAGVQGDCCTSALTIDPLEGTFLIGLGDHIVHALNPSTGATTVLGVGAPVGSSITALAMSCTGMLVVAATEGGVTKLYRSDLQSAPVLIGEPNLGVATSLEFDHSTDILYGWFNESGSDQSRHGTVSLENAQLADVSLILGRYRMAIDNTCPPELLRIFQDGFENG